MAPTPTTSILKRKAEDILVDPDTLKPTEDAKKTRIDLKADKKYSCITSIVEMYWQILTVAFGGSKTTDPSKIDTDDESLQDIAC